MYIVLKEFTLAVDKGDGASSGIGAGCKENMFVL